MADYKEINMNATLDDLDFTTLEPGDYHYKVLGYEQEYFNGSEKLPPCNKIVVTVEIPFKGESGMETKTVKNNFYLCNKKGILMGLRRFFESTGVMPEKGKAKMDWDATKGKTGVCSVITNIGNNGNEFNNIDGFYSPSKAPTITSNDDVWEDYLNDDGFMDVTDGVGDLFDV